MVPALISTSIYIENLTGEKFRKLEILDLFLFLRCQEVKDDVGSNRMWIEMFTNIKNRKLFFTRYHRLFKFNFIEKYPGHTDVFRLTQIGMSVCRHFMEATEKAHRDIKQFAESEPPESSSKINHYIKPWNV